MATSKRKPRAASPSQPPATLGSLRGCTILPATTIPIPTRVSLVVRRRKRRRRSRIQPETDSVLRPALSLSFSLLLSLSLAVTQFNLPEVSIGHGFIPRRATLLVTLIPFVPHSLFSLFSRPPGESLFFFPTARNRFYRGQYRIFSSAGPTTVHREDDFF